VVIEIDITRPSFDKLPIFAGLGIPEVWRYDGRALSILRLSEHVYREQDASSSLPGVTGADLTRWIDVARSANRPDWIRHVGEWAAALKPARTND
jgi:hypothetical protein